ncbi:MAG: hypothetical protein IJR49_05965, partial [Treponema sp.]|nr:hypothetical protein [Treponema sp.]
MEKINPNGLLTLKNTANFSVLVFTDSIAPQNYIGTVPALSSINVFLSPNKFYNIVAVSKELYEKEKDLAYQSSTLAYYSNVQAYTISVSPENMTGSA